MFGDDAVSAMVKYLNRNKDEITDFTGQIFAYERNERYAKSEYIAVNHLDFVRKNVVEEGVVNVNVHVAKLASNEPNKKRLSVLTKRVVSLFPKPINLNGAWFEFYSDGRPTLDNDETYYVNLKFNVTFSNLKE